MSKIKLISYALLICLVVALLWGFKVPLSGRIILTIIAVIELIMLGRIALIQ